SCMNPEFSVIVIVHNMRREAPRTLFSLSASYQTGIEANEYEVIVVENGSTDPLDPYEIERAGSNFRYHRHKTLSTSPVEAVNIGAQLARAERLVVCVDGARILSPGVLGYMRAAFQAFPNPFVYTLGWHLGDEPQNFSMIKGYDQVVE